MPNLGELYSYFRINERCHDIADAILDGEIGLAVSLARSAGYLVEAQDLEDIDDAL